MASQTIFTWTRLYARPEDIGGKDGIHIVGPCPIHGLLEVAVPTHSSASGNYQTLSGQSHPSTNSPRVAQTSSKTLRELPLSGRERSDFIETARKGISSYGTSLVCYYREHYNCETLWIEFVLMMNTLSAIGADPATEATSLPQVFARAILFVALSSASPDDQLFSMIRESSSADVINLLRKGLFIESTRMKPDSNILVMTRSILYTVGANTSKSNINLHPNKELNFTRAIYSLLGGKQPEKLQPRTDVQLFLGNLQRTRLFRGYFLDQVFVDHFIRSCGLEMWSCVQYFWDKQFYEISEFNLQKLYKLLSYVYDLDQALITTDNFNKMIAISKCQNPSLDSLKHDDILRAFFHSSESLMRVTTETQMAFDLLTMVNIAQRYPEVRNNKISANTLDTLRQMIITSSIDAKTSSFECLLSSFAHACEGWKQRQDVSIFFRSAYKELKPPNKCHEILISYFCSRLDGKSHHDAMEKLSGKCMEIDTI